MEEGEEAEEAEVEKAEDGELALFFDAFGERGGGERGERSGESVCVLVVFLLLLGERGAPVAEEPSLWLAR